MASKWYYSKDGQRHGPVSSSEVMNLANSGDLLPTDLLWKEGMAEWEPAINARGLFSATPASTVESFKASPASPQVEAPPVVPVTAQKQTLVEAAKGAARGAAQYAAKQTERTKLTKLTLPPLYQALGRHTLSSPDFRAEFAELFQQLDQVNAELSEISGRSPVTANSFGDKAKAMAGQAMQAAQKQKISLRQSSLLGTLGKAVYDKHEAASGPQELVKPIADTVARLAMLDSELDGLSSSKDGSWITPKRLAIAVGGIGCLAVLLFVLYGLRTTSLHAGMIPLKGEPDRNYEDNTFLVKSADKTVEKATRPGLIRVELNEPFIRSNDLDDDVHVMKLYGQNTKGDLECSGDFGNDMFAIRRVGKDVEMLLQIYPSQIWMTFIKSGEKPGGKWQSIEGSLKHVCEYVAAESTNGGTAVVEQTVFKNSQRNPIIRRRWYLQQSGGVLRLDIFGSGKGNAAKYWIPLRQLMCEEWKGDKSPLVLEEIELRSSGK
jgi:hypothetical protein